MSCECGGDRFMGRQICRHDSIVNGQGDWLADHGVYDSETPYGPFTCLNCGKVYDELPKHQNNEIALAMLKVMFSK